MTDNLTFQVRVRAITWEAQGILGFDGVPLLPTAPLPAVDRTMILLLGRQDTQPGARSLTGSVVTGDGPTDRDAVWQLRLLGGLRLDDGARTLTRLPSRAITALLARLALAPDKAHAREELVELLWPGVALDVGRNRLRQSLSTLKSILEPVSRTPHQPVLLADRTHVRVAPGAWSCDVVAFERAVRAGDARLADSLYGGELLPGFYDAWIDDERTRLAAVHDRLMASVAAASRVVHPVINPTTTARRCAPTRRGRHPHHAPTRAQRASSCPRT